MALRQRVSDVSGQGVSAPGASRALVRWLVVVSLSLVAVSLAWVTDRVEVAGHSLYPLSSVLRFHPLLAALDASSDRAATDGKSIPVELPFAPGQTVSEVLAELNLPPDEVHSVVQELAKHTDLRRIRPRDRYAVIYDPPSGLSAFELTLDGKGTAAVERGGRGWHGSWRPFKRHVAVRSLSGRLDDSLERAIVDAGGEGAVAFLMADVLQWDLDFTRDLRTGDRFDILFEAVYLDGDYYSLGDIVALSYDSGGRRLEAYRHGAGDEHGYYDADGRPLRKMFLRSPMRYSRITSRFTGRRFHPVLKRYRPHYGVDYGAPTGTPVRVTANGVVVSAGWNGGGGRMIKVRHPNGYLTAYLHLSKFASGLRSGSRVQQGDVIGYVGSTGLATGPHLDYRVQRDGRWIDPLSLKSMPAEPVPAEAMTEFIVERDRLRRSLWQGAPYEVPEQPGEFAVAARTVDRASGG